MKKFAVYYNCHQEMAERTNRNMAKKNLKTTEILDYIDNTLVDMKRARINGYSLAVTSWYNEIDGIISMLYMLDAIDNNTMIELTRKNDEARYS